MAHVTISQLWTAALAIRLIAIIIGIAKRAPGWWITWAVFSEGIGLALRYFDYRHMGGVTGPYTTTWIIGSALGVVLLYAVTEQITDPPISLMIVSCAVAFVIFLGFHSGKKWPASNIEAVTGICGGLALALGIMATLSSIERMTVSRGILCAYLLMYSALMIAAPDYLTSPALGRAWQTLEISAFTAWGIFYWFYKPHAR